VDAPISFEDRGPVEGFVLLCPDCGERDTHLDDIYIAGRPREDGDIVPVHVDHRGQVDNDTAMPSAGGRRHTISVGGWCEHCGSRFAIVFEQHKGKTYVRTLRQRWTA
jgi:hypothetical protein